MPKIKTIAMTTTDWQIQPLANDTHYTLTNATQLALKDGLEACAAKAINLLNDNIQDDSLYLLFEWNPQTNSLKVVVTDANKQQDAPISVGADFEQTDIATEQVKFLLSDYLASCSAFFRYSLVAIFHSSSRTDSTLL
ncbi:hypothetical protein [Cellvibrio sp. NN19]|uniref:hypothetical protein n=1 Tax=Cellvibrio chitinivorans TaxID=3102792 RepID=UPI002B40DEE4|nr:hypothetical protein [Cellvibrio sp. NN19]